MKAFQNVSEDFRWDAEALLKRYEEFSWGSEPLRCVTWGSRGFEGDFEGISGRFRAFSVGLRGVTEALRRSFRGVRSLSGPGDIRGILEAFEDGDLEALRKR